MHRLVIVNFNYRNDPERNHEFEKFLYKLPINKEDIILRFWINSPSVFIGRFQKEEMEVDLGFLKAKKIPIIKRFTGGGTVYHDWGTLNITYSRNIASALKEAKAEQIKITNLIKKALQNLGVEVRSDERNSLFIGENKILGSAVAMSKNKFLYHASILVHTNLNYLRKAINWLPNYQDVNVPCVASHRSPVMNIQSLYKELTIDHLSLSIVNTFREELQVKELLHIRNKKYFDIYTDLLRNRDSKLKTELS